VGFGVSGWFWVGFSVVDGKETRWVVAGERLKGGGLLVWCRLRFLWLTVGPVSSAGFWSLGLFWVGALFSGGCGLRSSKALLKETSSFCQLNAF
jgi:hypothetical protein